MAAEVRVLRWDPSKTWVDPSSGSRSGPTSLATDLRAREEPSGARSSFGAASRARGARGRGARSRSMAGRFLRFFVCRHLVQRGIFP